jgi:hypothetical protein
MRRREFITLVNGAAPIAWPDRTLAQQRTVPVVGFLAYSTSKGFAPRVAAVRAGLLGKSIKKNIMGFDGTVP